jgi:hypothetical protein
VLENAFDRGWLLDARDRLQLPAAALRLYLLTDEQDGALPVIEPVG